MGLPADIDVNVGSTRSSNGTLTASFDYVLPAGYEVPATSIEQLGASPIAAPSSDMGVLGSVCKSSVWRSGDETCVNNYITGANATWENSSTGGAGSTRVFRLRLSVPMTSNCATDQFVVTTGSLRTVGAGQTYVLSYTSPGNFWFATSGWNSALTVRSWKHCFSSIA